MGTWLGVIGVMVGLVSLGFAFVQRQVKRLTYQESRRADLSPRAGVFEDVDVVYNGERLAQPWYGRLRLANDGKVEIRTDDFEVPLSVKWEGAQLLAVEVTASHPPALDVHYSIDEESFLSVSPLLLNAGDWFDIDVLLDGDPAPPAIATRVAGVRHVESVDSRAKRQGRWYWTFGAALTIGAMVVLALVPDSAPKGLWGVATGVVFGALLSVGATLPGKGTAPFEGRTKL